VALSAGGDGGGSSLSEISLTVFDAKFNVLAFYGEHVLLWPLL
jgi:hypothetical protein